MAASPQSKPGPVIPPHTADAVRTERIHAVEGCLRGRVYGGHAGAQENGGDCVTKAVHGCSLN